MTGPTTPPAAQQASRTRTAALSWQLAADSIDDLFQRALDQRGKASIIAMFDQVVALKRYAGWNAFLISVQRPGTVAVASASEWRTRFNRTILPLARPIVILHPFGPVRFVYDLTDTEGPDHPQLRWRDPFAVKTDLAPPSAGSMDRLYKTLDKRDGITVQVDDYGGLFAGVAMRVQAVPGSGQQTLWPQFRIRMARRLKPAEALVTLAHELGHVYCGHLGPFLPTKPQNGKPPPRPWDDRHAVLTKGQCEFEAESVGYLTAARNGIETRSAEYLAGYIAETDLPHISVAAVMRAATRIESHMRKLEPLDAEP